MTRRLHSITAGWSWARIPRPPHEAVRVRRQRRPSLRQARAPAHDRPGLLRMSDALPPTLRRGHLRPDAPRRGGKASRRRSTAGPDIATGRERRHGDPFWTYDSPRKSRQDQWTLRVTAITRRWGQSEVQYEVDQMRESARIRHAGVPPTRRSREEGPPSSTPIPHHVLIARIPVPRRSSILGELRWGQRLSSQREDGLYQLSRGAYGKNYSVRGRARVCQMISTESASGQGGFNEGRGSCARGKRVRSRTRRPSCSFRTRS